MAFCNSCGAALNPGTRFCNKCGATVLASAPASAFSSAAPSSSTPSVTAATTQAAPSQGGGALKVILIVVGVLVLMGILGVASVGFFAWRVARHSHVRQEGNNVKVETPFGSVESSQDPEAAARNLDVETYPGAQVLKEGATSATFMGIHTVTARFESSDSLDKVSTFYKSRYPNATVTTCSQRHCAIVTNDQNNTISINMEDARSGTRIEITHMTRHSK